jgi:hypothetical protein
MNSFLFSLALARLNPAARFIGKRVPFKLRLLSVVPDMGHPAELLDAALGNVGRLCHSAQAAPHATEDYAGRPGGESRSSSYVHQFDGATVAQSIPQRLAVISQGLGHFFIPNRY